MYSSEWTNWAVEAMEREIIFRGRLVEKIAQAPSFHAEIFTRFNNRDGNSLMGHLSLPPSRARLFEGHPLYGIGPLEVWVSPKKEMWEGRLFMSAYMEWPSDWLNDRKIVFLQENLHTGPEPIASASLPAMQHLLQLYGAVCHISWDAQGDEKLFLGAVQYRLGALLTSNARKWRQIVTGI